MSSPSATDTLSFRDGALSAFTRVCDALWRRTRNPEAHSEIVDGFRVRAFRAPRNDNRGYSRTLATAALLGALLGGCSEHYTERRDTVTLYSGDAVATNRVTHMIDPWPVAAGQRNIAYNGEKAAVASERYRTGRVIPPVNATTSSVAYNQAAQAAQSTANTQAPNAGASNSNSPTK